MSRYYLLTAKILGKFTRMDAIPQIMGRFDDHYLFVYICKPDSLTLGIRFTRRLIVRNLWLILD